MRISDLKISISGIRGIVGKSLTPQLITKFSEAFSSYIGGGKIAVGSDTRPSAGMVKHAVFSGLLSCGASPVDLGILPIPSLQIYTKEKKLAGAISITASHNPVEWNALKLIKKGGYFLFPIEAEELLDFYYQGKFRRVQVPEGIEIEKDPFIPHQKKIDRFIDIDRIKKKKPKVIVDPCGGAAAPYVSAYLEKLGAEVICINGEWGGGFPRNPEPVSGNITALCEAVLKHGADIGFAQDADADRLAVVDERGIPIGEENTLALAVDSYLKIKRASPVVVNLSTSRVIKDIAVRAGVKLYRTKVGEINVARKMALEGASVGGEGNGGIIVSDVHRCRDSFTGMALLLEYLSWSGEKTSELRAGLPDYFMIKDKVKASFREGKRILDKLNSKFGEGECDDTDGLRVDFPDFWYHVRPSNTEPVVRIIVEGKDKETAEKIFNKIKEEI
jgi:phosphomannomutase